MATQCIVVIFKLSCQSGDFLGSSTAEHFERKVLKAFGLQTKKLENGPHELTVTRKRL